MAEFKYYLNRQGVRGPQGPQGEKGFSPDISVEKDTLSEYVLRITNEGGYFLTANLREHKEDRGGTYIRYDRGTGVMYAGDAELATTDTLGVIRIAKDEDFAGKAEDTAVTPAQVQDYTAEKVAEVNQRIDSLDATNVKLTGKQTVAGTKTFTDGIVTDRISLSNGNSVLRPDAGRIRIGSTSNTAGTKLEGPYVDIIGTNVDIYGKFTARGFADFDANTTFYQDAIIKGSAKDDNNNLYLKQNTITAGDNVQIVNTADGIKISSSAPTNVVTTDTDQTITGGKTFDKIILPADSLNKGIYIEGNSSPSINAFYGTLNIRNVNQFRCANLYVSDSSKNGQIQIGDYPTTGNSQILFTGYNGSNTALINAISHNVIEKKINVGDDLCTTVINGQSIVNKNNKKFLAQGSVTAGDNISIEETTDGIKISSTGGGAGDVTLAGDNSFTGNNTFNGVSTFNGDTWIDFLKVGTSLTNQQDKKFLAQGSITAGSDNLLITETTDGVQIICNAPTNAQIEALQRLINDLSTKIDNLTTRLNNLEEVIDGGVAGSIYPADPQKIDANPIIDNALSGGQAQSEEIQVKDGE